MKSNSALLSLSFVLACSFVACAKKEPAPQPAPQPATTEAAPQPVVKKEVKPATVADIQEKLIEHGARKLKADGKMGPATKSALKKFQAKNGRKKTGVADKETLAKLGLA
jgi:peptidoglycan hydrolase-like protein with peptidoglycan-binding domain